MKNLLFLVAVLSILTWTVGYFWYHQGMFIHLFLAGAFVASGGWFSIGRLVVVK